MVLLQTVLAMASISSPSVMPMAKKDILVKRTSKTILSIHVKPPDGIQILLEVDVFEVGASTITPKAGGEQAIRSPRYTYLHSQRQGYSDGNDTLRGLTKGGQQ